MPTATWSPPSGGSSPRTRLPGRSSRSRSSTRPREQPEAAAGRPAGARPDPGAGRPLLHDDPRRPRRRRGQGRATGDGDGSRRWGPPFVGGESAYFMQVNRNKRSIAVDLRTDEGREVVRRMVERADVVLHNFLPDASVRYGADAASVHAVNPLAVHCTITGYPTDGEHASSPGYDFLMQGIGGIMSIQGEPDGEPIKVAVAIADLVAGLYAATGVLSALVERAVTGAGRTLEVALIDAQVSWLANRAGDWLIAGIEPE